MQQDNYVLHYFPLNGRAALIRAMFDIKGVEFTERLITFEQWATLDKSEFEYGFLPVLEVNGKRMSQTGAIETFLARKFGFYPQSFEDQAVVDEILSSRSDWLDAFVVYIFSQGKVPEEETKKQLKNLREETFPWIFNIYEQKFNKKKGKYFVGDSLTVVDIYFGLIHFFFFHDSRKGQFDDIATKYAPNLFKWAAELRENELKAFFSGKHFIAQSPM